MAARGNASKRRANVERWMALAFLLVILVGTGLLMLPAASRDGRSCGFVTALFTATSATCVTGLSVADTWTQFSGFGQVVLLGLIEIGGLGFMSLASALIFLFRGRMGMAQQMVMAQSLGSEDYGDLIGLQKRMLAACLSAQAAGAALLAARFAPVVGVRQAIRYGLFHSVSAFCNAGFDLFGRAKAGASLTILSGDAFSILVLSALIVSGGLGFVVWEELARKRSWKKLSAYAKLAVTTTLALLAGGMALIALAEWNNPATLGGMAPGGRALNAFFQSVTLRTAGFFSVDQAALTDAGKAVSMFFMLVGGSSGSTAGGLKTVTLAVIVLFLFSRMRGRSTVSAYHRTIAAGPVLNAFTVLGIMVGLSFFGAVFVLFTSEGVTFVEALFETVSAIGTVGLSLGVTAKLSVPSKLLIAAYMYFGRVGVLTISLGFLREKQTEARYRYADASLLIG